MKINDTQRIGAYRAYQNTNEARTGQTESKRRKDEVQISTEAKELLDAQGQDDTARAERIESLKREVSTGTYHVETNKLAETLLPFFRPFKSND
ncbi:flagellar biosynthesis anti-sigma factor FlgM [Cohnella nanjingensis]|uniref:Negative regulator of flagellin synthesis n=1 Tax=Cohnella nanjingensis TaxID=1387779 RepID=A0A7X0RSR8_9BACL|nr:flagellar biosynthesis anti-sigma factor FlgM [Cohnella nanjingensis]MBB6671524.1 flagellar biosynthesis anti-sigma factor FlgM [Cohnella nanjingensis]